MKRPNPRPHPHFSLLGGVVDEGVGLLSLILRLSTLGLGCFGPASSGAALRRWLPELVKLFAAAEVRHLLGGREIGADQVLVDFN